MKMALYWELILLLQRGDVLSPLVFHVICPCFTCAAVAQVNKTPANKQSFWEKSSCVARHLKCIEDLT